MQIFSHLINHAQKEVLTHMASITYAQYRQSIRCFNLYFCILCRYFDYVNFNTTGFRPYVTTVYAVILGCLRKTLSRILVLIVSMGFGVILPYLGAIQRKVESKAITFSKVLKPYSHHPKLKALFLAAGFQSRFCKTKIENSLYYLACFKCQYL